MVGSSLNIDDNFLKNLEKADNVINRIAESSQKMSKVVIESFKNVNDNALKPFIENLNGIRKALDSKAKPIVFKEIDTQASKVVDKINQIATTFDKVFVGGKAYKFGALEKINYEIDEAVKKLSILQGRLNFYAKGEGQKAIGFADTTSMQKEAELLMQKIKLLEDERKTIIDNAKARIQESLKQERIDSAWYAMEQAKIALLKEEASITNALVKSRSSNIIAQREEQQRMYEKLFHDAIANQYKQMWGTAEKMLANKQKAEKEDYEIWLRQKSKEVEEHKLAEERKLQATREVIKQQNELMTIEASRKRSEIAEQQKKEQEATQRVNQQIQARYTYTSEVERMYAQMFDRIAAKEKEKEAEARKYEQSLYEDSLTKYRKMKQDQANVDKHYHNQRQREYDEMFRAIERNEKRIRQINNKYGDSSKGAKNYFNRLFSENGVLSINKMNTALQKIQEAQSKLNLKTEEGIKKYEELNKRAQYLQRVINGTTQGINNMDKSHRRLMDTVGQLQRKMALLFSVSAIQGYVNKLVQIRGEFEMQQKSLQVLLQNKDEADKLWQQTIDLAIRSPFRVKELISYTRQLAAYRIENEKLHDTTRRLSDVSAGLGVDMQRIILAFGQVRAANFLRGTELRQFTEAGIPMLDELAKYFTELEGRMVSAGEVFERISKRMVMFSDVEEVFHRMTNAGGVFYKMQEEQSKTLQGMISNLHDSIDLMLNDIGKANDGLLKGSVDSARNLVENWREVAIYIKEVVFALAAWKVANAAYLIGTKEAATATLWGNAALKRNIGTTMAMTKQLQWSERAVMGVTKSQYLLGKSTLYLQGTLRGVGMAIQSFLPLAVITALGIGITELWRNLTKASREAKELAKELSEIYNEDTTNLEKQTNVFKDLAERLKSVTQGSKEHKNIISQLNSEYGEYLGFLVTEKTSYDEIATSINSVIEALNQKAKMQTFEKALNKIVENSVKKISTAQTDIEDMIGRIGVYREVGKPNLMPTESELNDIFNLYEKKVREANSLVNVNSVFSDYYGENIQIAAKIGTKFSEIGREILNQKKEEEKLQNKLNSLYSSSTYSSIQMRQEMEALNQEREKALKNETTRIGRDKIEYDYLVKKTKLEGKYQGLDESKIEYNVSQIKKTSETVQDINRQIIESTAELGEKAVNRVYITAQDASQGVNAIAERMAALYKSSQEEIKQENALIEAGTVHSQDKLDNAIMMSKAYYKVLEIMGRLDLLESKGAKQKSEAKILRNRINLVQQLYKEYTNLSKRFDEKDAEERVRKSFEDTFQEAFEGTGINLSMYSISKELIKSAQEVGKDAGSAMTDAMLEKLNKLKEAGTYIRSASKDVIEFTKQSESFMSKAYWDKLAGVWTVGYGTTSNAGIGFKVTKDTIVDQQQAEELLIKTYKVKEGILNNILDKHKDLIITQEQYNALLDAAYQGGGAKAAIDFAYGNWEKFESYLRKISEFKQANKKHVIIDIEQIKKEWEALDTLQEKIALALKWTNITTTKNGERYISSAMQKRSMQRAAMFSGDLDIAKQLKEVVVEIAGIDFTNISGVIEILKKLMPIAKKEGKEAILELSRAISDTEIELGVNAKIEDDKTLVDRIEKLFSGYEMSIELQKLNIPPDLAKQLFNIDSIDLSGLKSRVEGLQSLFIGTDMEGKYKEYLQKISEMEDKEQVERLKSYTKYIIKAQSERTRITFEALEKIREAEEMHQQGKFNETEMNNIRENINKERDKALADLAFNEFKNSDLYLKMFEDFDAVSIPVLEAMKERVENLRKSLKELGASSEDVKNLTQQLEKIDDAIKERNPFKDLFKNIKEYRKLQGERDKTESEYKEKLEENEKLTKALAEASKEVGSAKSEYNKAMEQATENQTLKNAQSELDIAKAILAVEINAHGAETQKAIALQREVDRKQQAYDVTYKTLVLENKSVKTSKARLDNANKAEESAKNALNKSNTDLSALLSKLKDMEELSEKIAYTLQFVSQVFQELASTVTDVASSLENVFGAMDAKTLDTTNSISEILGGLGNTASGVGRVMSNPMDIGGYFQAISGLASTMGSIFAIGDKKKERQIQREIKFVEDLQRAYEKLEKAINNAYSINTLQASGQAAKRNLDAQIASYNKMIAAEEAKKKTDNDRIKEWQLAVEDLIEQKAELDKELVSVATSGIMDDVLSASQEFTNAWLEAFNETGDGLSGLETNFKETMLEMVKQQAAMLISQSYVDKWKKQLEQYINPDDLELSTDEAKKWVDAVSNSLPQLNDALTRYFEAMKQAGVDLSGGEQSELSGLQRGISGITESQADILAAYANSCRFFLANIDTTLASIANQILGGENMPNPILSELRTQTELVRGISTLLNSVVRGSHSMGGQGIKVFIS